MKNARFHSCQIPTTRISTASGECLRKDVETTLSTSAPVIWVCGPMCCHRINEPGGVWHGILTMAIRDEIIIPGQEVRHGAAPRRSAVREPIGCHPVRGRALHRGGNVIPLTPILALSPGYLSAADRWRRTEVRRHPCGDIRVMSGLSPHCRCLGTPFVRS